jgi:hypothetical protein
VTDVETIREALHLLGKFAALPSTWPDGPEVFPGAVFRSVAALDRLVTERNRLRGELAYAVECGSLGVVPNWSVLSEEDRDEWIAHAKKEGE